ncbi:glycosyltransferase [Sphingomonas sp.]|uniref:glycosyltransferase n=1 Tax=Sphingomonas sp. TaxID=28214 RepID=UPI001B26300B|nr:glycosyltransferase [Sphingomonas sp.]MBO9714537.1 glycosyltransferase [Sphingomonas sp.]
MSREEPRITIVHLAVDYNTPQRPRTTRAIEWTIGELGEFDNVVVAYRRTTRRGERETEVATDTVKKLYDFPFFGLPLGLGLHGAMRAAAKRTIRRLEADGIRPRIVHAHKLTFEGLAGYYVARHFGVPLLVSLRGEVETKVFRFKPQLRPFLRKVSRRAAALYFVSAWFRDEFRRHVPGLETRERLLPNIVRNIAPVIDVQPANDRFVTVLDLNTWKRKGVTWLLEGFALALAREPSLKLDLIGGGSEESVGLVRKLIEERKLGEAVSLLGPMPNAQVLARLPAYRALLLPSVNETFGMVFVEALFAGIPVLFTEGTAIDGYLGGLDVGRTVPPRDASAIADAILALWQDPEGYRARIAAAGPALFAAFDPEASITRYRDDIRAAVAGALVGQD